MFTLLDMLKEANIPLSLFCQTVGMTMEEAIELSNTRDSHTQMDLYLQFVTALNDEQLFPELLDLFSPYVSDRDTLALFITSVLRYRQNNIPRRMLNSIERLVTLADDTEKIRPAKHSLKIFYFVVCIETLYHLAGNELNKTITVIDFFNTHISEEDKRLILDRFNRSLADDKFFIEKLPNEPDENYEERMKTTVDRTLNTQITMEVFSRIINELRNCFAHEGDYWNFHFASSDHSVINSLIVAENQDEYKLKSKGRVNTLKRIYSVDLTYDQFKAACMRGYLQFVSKYFETIKENKE